MFKKRRYSHLYFEEEGCLLTAKSNAFRGLKNIIVFSESKCSQVWIETVIYTLIGLTIMATLLWIITPKVNTMIDETAIERARGQLNDFDEAVSRVLYSPGMRLEFSVDFKKGDFVVDSSGDSVYYVLKETLKKFSEVNQLISGDINILTKNATSKKYDVYLIINYSSSGINVTYNDEDKEKVFSSSPTPYKILISNEGGLDKRIDISSI